MSLRARASGQLIGDNDMARTVYCVLLGRDAEGLDRPPYPGELGQRKFTVIRSEERVALSVPILGVAA